MCIWDELVVHVWKVLRHECSEVTIFAEMEQVLLVEGIDFAVTILIDDRIGDDQWFAFISSP